MSMHKVKAPPPKKPAPRTQVPKFKNERGRVPKGGNTGGSGGAGGG
jgi:hypothetical protein